MPSYTRGKKRENTVFVIVNDYLYYGFKTKDFNSITGVTASDITALGHVAADAIPAGNTRVRVIGANSPKPPRMTKKITSSVAGEQRSVSTFCSYNNLGTAQAVGWNLSKTRRNVSLRSATGQGNSITAIAELSDGSLYCFPMNKADFDSYAVELGLKSAIGITTDAERGKLVAGSSIPKPGKASKILTGGAVFSSFYSTSKAGDLAGADYNILSDEIVLTPPAAPST